PVLLAQPQSLGQEQEVELGPLRGPGEVLERAEIDVAAGPRVAPHRGVVHPGEVRGQVDLLDRLGHGGVLPARLMPSRTGWRAGASPAACEASRPDRTHGTRRAPGEGVRDLR